MFIAPVSRAKASGIPEAFSCDALAVTATDLAGVAKVIANPTSAAVLDSLLSGRQLTISGLASELRLGRSTVSEAVTALAVNGLVLRQRHGRVTLVRLGGPDVADALEALGRLTKPQPPIGLRAVNRMQALRSARTCYDHLAGIAGVGLADSLLRRGVLLELDGTWSLTPRGAERLVTVGIDAKRLSERARRPLVRMCPDWTERRPHLAGRLGAAICDFWLQAGLATRLPGSRALRVTPDAAEWLQRI